MEIFYQNLKAYTNLPIDQQQEQRHLLEAQFEQFFTHSGFEALNQTLKRLHPPKAELLLVLEKLELPLDNNESERDICKYVIRRKISGGTNSESGRRSRYTCSQPEEDLSQVGDFFLGIPH